MTCVWSSVCFGSVAADHVTLDGGGGGATANPLRETSGADQ